MSGRLYHGSPGPKVCKKQSKHLHRIAADLKGAEQALSASVEA